MYDRVMKQNLRFLRVLLAVSASALAVGCKDRGTTAATAPAASAPPGAGAATKTDYEFLVDGRPRNPVEWARTPAAAAPGGGALLAKLKVGEFRDLVAKNDAVALRNHLVGETEALKALSGAKLDGISWDKGALVLPAGERLAAEDLAAYFAAIEKWARAGQWTNTEYVPIAQGMLSLGYQVYESDTSQDTRAARVSVWEAAWGAAFRFYERQMLSERNDKGRESWKVRREELKDAAAAMK
ncbi:MAG TPA: hypothetical protein VD997_15230 [Phycisphaerales bacterium]|nr:hypothetical protein [Phycisphaerales bacterium]